MRLTPLQCAISRGRFPCLKVSQILSVFKSLLNIAVISVLGSHHLSKEGLKVSPSGFGLAVPFE